MPKGHWESHYGEIYAIHFFQCALQKFSVRASLSIFASVDVAYLFQIRMKNVKIHPNKILSYILILSIVTLKGILLILLRLPQLKGSIHLVNYGSWLSTHPKNGVVPYGMNSCTIILAAKLIGEGRRRLGDRMNGLSGARHLFVNFFENGTRYGLIEAGHVGTNVGYGGRSFARVRTHHWDHGGLQWRVLTPKCQETIRCFKRNTIRYHRASLPYHFYFGPNSNSFMWWLFKQCSMDITPTFAAYPFVGIDYFWTHKFPSNSTKL